MKRVAIGLAIFVAVLVASVFILHSSLGTIITQAVNFKGPKIVQAKVHLKETIIDATSGKGSMRGLIIGNPKGFKTESAFKVDKVEITLDTDSIASNIIVIKEINIQAPEITYEKGDDGSNIDVIQRNVDAFIKKYSGASESPESKEKSVEKKGGTKMIIDHVYVKDAKLNVNPALLGGNSMTLALSDIHLRDIGKNENGATSGEVAEAIIDAINKAIHKSINPIHPENIGGVVGKVITGAKGVIQGTSKGIFGK